MGCGCGCGDRVWYWPDQQKLACSGPVVGDRLRTASSLSTRSVNFSIELARLSIMLTAVTDAASIGSSSESACILMLRTVRVLGTK